MFKATPIQYNASLVYQGIIILDHPSKDAPIRLDVTRYIDTLVRHANKQQVAKIMNELVIFFVANGSFRYSQNLLQYCLRQDQHAPLEAALKHGLDIHYKNPEMVITEDVPGINFLAGAKPNGEKSFERILLSCFASEKTCHILFDYGATLPSFNDIANIDQGSEKLLCLHEYHKNWIASKVNMSDLPIITKTRLPKI